MEDGRRKTEDGRRKGSAFSVRQLYLSISSRLRPDAVKAPCAHRPAPCGFSLTSVRPTCVSDLSLTPKSRPADALRHGTAPREERMNEAGAAIPRPR